MKRPETPVEIAFDNWLDGYHDGPLGAVDIEEVYGGTGAVVLTSGADLRRMMAAAFDAGWDAGEDA